MALGFLIGAIQVPLPGIGKLAVGLAGVLIVALFLGKLRRTGGMNWTIPLSANLVIRNLGLTLFLAQVGMASGPKFAATVTETGFTMLGLGAVVLVALVVPILILGLFVFRRPFDEVAGIVSGACGNPAILAYTNKLTPTDRPDVAFAMIFPGMTIVKILFVDIVPALFGSPFLSLSPIRPWAFGIGPRSDKRPPCEGAVDLTIHALRTDAMLSAPGNHAHHHRCATARSPTKLGASHPNPCGWAGGRSSPAVCGCVVMQAGGRAGR